MIAPFPAIEEVVVVVVVVVAALFTVEFVGAGRVIEVMAGIATTDIVFATR